MDILEVFNAALGSPAIRQASAWLGESEENTRAAVRSVGPTLMAGVLQRAGTPAGVSEIFRQVTGDRIDSGIAGRLVGLFGNRGSFESLQTTGESLTGMLFGERTGNVANAISQVSGVQPNSAMTLLSMGVPLLFGMLKKYITQNNLDTSAFSSLLSRQQRTLERHLMDNRIAGALGFGSTAELLGSLPAVGAPQSVTQRAAPMNGRDRSWLPWATAAAVAVLGVMFFVSRTAEHQETSSGGVQVAEVADTAAPSGAAVPTSVYFESGDANIDQEDRLRIASVAQSARSADRPVAITGYTDRNGDENRNRELANDRALAVRDALVSEGVAESKIVVDPPRTVSGSGSDDEGRRVDIDMR